MSQSAASKREASQNSEERLTQFVADASHEIVGPMNQVSSLVALFVNRYRGRLDDDADKLLTYIEGAGTRMSAAAEGLRSYFRVLNSQIERRRVDTRAALLSALQALKTDIDACGAEISFGELPDVAGDATLLEGVFHALIENAIKFRRPDGLPRIQITVERTSVGHLFTVSDEGIGIDPQYAERVFVPFSRLNERSFPGSGLGLSMARASVEKMLGRIWIGSSSEGGAVVCFELPDAC